MYDAVIIGAGPAGYVCAVSLARQGAKVCVVEKNGLGGTCTHRGCIPTKYLHSMGDILRKAKSAKKFGINSNIEVDYSVLRSKMKSIVTKLASGIGFLFKEYGVELIEGKAVIKSQNQVVVNNTTLETKNIVLATGSKPRKFPANNLSEKIVSTDSVFELESLPESILVVGGGYSGCEFASILHALGCKIWLVEMEDSLLPCQPKEVGVAIEKYMKLDGISVMTKASMKITDDGKVMINDDEINPEKILISTGRDPNFNTDELDKLGITWNDNGITVNEYMQTNLSNVYAIGDIAGNYELAHVASHQGEIAAQNIMGEKNAIDYSAVPYCVFTYPEVAIVGKCDGNAKEFPMVVNAKANCLGDTRGFIKVFEENGILQGVIMVGAHASEIIGEATLAVRLKLKPKDIIDTIHAHPTLPEAFVDALRSLDGKSIHIL
jgi:dihydrolipoamide dehydrogenase